MKEKTDTDEQVVSFNKKVSPPPHTWLAALRLIWLWLMLHQNSMSKANDFLALHYFKLLVFILFLSQNLIFRLTGAGQTGIKIHLLMKTSSLTYIYIGTRDV